MLFYTALFVLLPILGLSTTSGRNKARAEARQLLQEGMTKEDDHKAIELLLSIEADYVKPSEGHNSIALPPRPFVVCVLLLFLVSVALSFPAKTTIGIGRGKRILAARRTWLKALNFVFVLFIFLAVGGSFLASTIYDYITK